MGLAYKGLNKYLWNEPMKEQAPWPLTYIMTFNLHSHPIVRLSSFPLHTWTQLGPQVKRLMPKSVSHKLSATSAASGTSHEGESPRDVVRPFLGSWTHMRSVLLELWGEKADGMGILHPLEAEYGASAKWEVLRCENEKFVPDDIVWALNWALWSWSSLLHHE